MQVDKCKVPASMLSQPSVLSASPEAHVMLYLMTHIEFQLHLTG